MKKEEKSKSKTNNEKDKFCDQCGNKLEGNFEFCPKCGSKVNHEEELNKKEVKEETKVEEIKDDENKVEEKHEDKIEEKIVDEEEIKKSDVERFQIRDDNRNEVVRVINEQIEDGLKNIQSAQRRLMLTRGCSDKKIEEINYKTTVFIRKYMKNKDSEIADIYARREKQLTNSVVKKIIENIKSTDAIDISSVEEFLNELLQEMQKTEALINKVDVMIEQIKNEKQVDSPSKEALIKKLQQETQHMAELIKKVNMELEGLKAMNSKQNSTKNAFKGSIDLTNQLPLEQQRANSEKFGKESKQLPSDILPDLFK